VTLLPSRGRCWGVLGGGKNGKRTPPRRNERRIATGIYKGGRKVNVTELENLCLTRKKDVSRPKEGFVGARLVGAKVDSGRGVLRLLPGNKKLVTMTA